VTPSQGNHGEDVKECYFHLDNTPTHSYLKLLYKYPQAEFPYQRPIAENQCRQGNGREFELLDSGVFDGDCYFDIFMEYAISTVEDMAIRIEAVNRGPQRAPLDILPHPWFRNTWSWGPEAWGPTTCPEPTIRPGPEGEDFLSLVSDDSGMEMLAHVPIRYRLGPRIFFAPRGGTPIFTDNESNGPVVFGPGSRSRKPYVKDAFHRWLIHGEECVNPAQSGTKAAIHYHFAAVPAGGSVTLRFRLSDQAGQVAPLAAVDAVIDQRRAEADEFYAAIHPSGAGEDQRRIQRQALAGLLWTKQSYIFDVRQWLDGDNPQLPPPASRRAARNQHWRHLNSLRVMTVPDKWEYPWFATWDLAFQCVAFTLIGRPVRPALRRAPGPRAMLGDADRWATPSQ